MPHTISKQALLQLPEVIDEINRHLWIESEKAGRDIGFEVAAQDWLEKYAKAWVSYHMPKKRLVKESSSKPKKAKSTLKSRKARTYV